MSNKYCDTFSERGVEATASNLLELLRAEVEPILEKHLPDDKTSIQSTRASRALEIVEGQYRSATWLAVTSKDAEGLAKYGALSRERRGERDILVNFLAVHRTVWILEGRAI